MKIRMQRIVQKGCSLTPVSLNDIWQRFTNDGFVCPLQVFDDNVFQENKYVEKYEEFRKQCKIQRKVPLLINNTQCKKTVTR